MRLPGGRKVTIDLEKKKATPAAGSLAPEGKSGGARKGTRSTTPTLYQGLDPELLVGSGVVVVGKEGQAGIVHAGEDGDDEDFTEVVSKKHVRREQKEAERRKKEEVCWVCVCV